MSYFKFNQGTLDWITTVNSTNYKIVVGILMGVVAVAWVIVTTTVAVGVAMVRGVEQVVTIPQTVLDFLLWLILGFSAIGSAQFVGKRMSDIDLAKAKASGPPVVAAPTTINQGVVNNPTTSEADGNRG